MTLPAVLIFAAIVHASAGVSIHVAPHGDDAAPGTTSHPVASLERAIVLSRAAASGEARRIVLATGDYLDTSVALRSQDSGLTIESGPGGRASLVGGVRLTGWETDGDRFWSAPLPRGRDWDVRMLQVNGRFCPRARYPETGTLIHRSVFDVPWMSTTGGGWKRKPTSAELTTLTYRKGDLPADLDTRNAEITVFHMWDESVAGIKGHDEKSATLTLAPPLGHPPGAFGVKTYCIGNVRQGMTRPGQWYFDRTRGRIVYWPLPGEGMSKAEVIVPTRRSVVRLSGATDVCLRGLDVSVTTVPLITGGFAAGAFDGAVQLDRADGATLTDLHVRNVAGQAIKCRSSRAPIRIEDCEISSCGAGGVYITGPGNVVRRSLIHDVGLSFPSAMGIHGGGKGAVLSHNEIHSTPYSAIGFGGEDVVIDHNLLSRCMTVMHDGAAIYTFGSKHARLSDNVARDIVDTGGYGASAYYLDEQCDGCVVERNIAINVARPSHNHMARNSTIRDNVFINSGDMTVTFPRCTNFTMARNVFYAAGQVTFEGTGAVTTWSKNLVRSGDSKVHTVVLKDYTRSISSSDPPGDTRVADPLFVDLPHLDLRYQAASPIIGLGLKSLDVRQGGRK
jgi:Right handed beta helix region